MGTRIGLLFVQYAASQRATYLRISTGYVREIDGVGMYVSQFRTHHNFWDNECPTGGTAGRDSAPYQNASIKRKGSSQVGAYGH